MIYAGYDIKYIYSSLFASQRVNGAHLRSLPCGIDSEEQSHSAGEQQRNNNQPPGNIRRYINDRTRRKRAGNTYGNAYRAAD